MAVSGEAVSGAMLVGVIATVRNFERKREGLAITYLEPTLFAGLVAAAAPETGSLTRGIAIGSIALLVSQIGRAILPGQPG